MKSDVKSKISDLAIQPEAMVALQAAADSVGRFIEDAILIQQIPAPTFEEARRAAFLHGRFGELGLSNVETDQLHNVYGRLPGSQPDLPALMVSAHLDTVFPGDTNLDVHRSRDRIAGPGLGDNSAGIAALIAVARLLMENKLKLPADVWLVGTVGEEGLGDLRGMRQAIKRLKSRLGLGLIVEGMALGHVFHSGLGVRRLKITINGPGGHSWLNFGRPSAIHHLLQLGAALTQLRVSDPPPSSMNIGLLEGGISINTIAPQASLSIDLRSEEAEALNGLEAKVRHVVEQHKCPSDVTTDIEIIGDRPAGRLARQHPLVAASSAALTTFGLQPIFEAASTDANVLLANRIPAVCIGVTTGGDAHNTNEYINTAPLAEGLQHLLLLTLVAAHNVREWSKWQAE